VYIQECEDLIQIEAEELAEALFGADYFRRRAGTETVGARKGDPILIARI
jgi:hypothetical protein